MSSPVDLNSQRSKTFPYEQTPTPSTIKDAVTRPETVVSLIFNAEKTMGW